jgi:hypothetical protein
VGMGGGGVGDGVGVRAGEGVAVGVGLGVGLGVGVGVAKCRQRARTSGRPSTQAWAPGAEAERNANIIAVAPKSRATPPRNPFISPFPPQKSSEADVVLRRSAARVSSTVPPTGKSCRS